jgi:hypothetical protein
MRKVAAPTAVLVSLLLIVAAPAVGSHGLSVARAKRAVVRVEHRYWRGTHVRLRFPRCVRESALVVECEILVGGRFVAPGPFEWVAIYDRASLRHGSIRVVTIRPHA